MSKKLIEVYESAQRTVSVRFLKNKIKKLKLKFL